MKKARDLMTRDPDCVTQDDTLQRAASIMRDRDVGAVPVVSDSDSRRLVGIVTDRDIAIRHVAEGHREVHTVRDVMSAGTIATAREEDSADRVMELMKQHKVRRIPVLGEDERIVGMIAQADLALDTRDDRKVGKTVEEISEPGRK